MINNNSETSQKISNISPIAYSAITGLIEFLPFESISEQAKLVS